MSAGGGRTAKQVYGFGPFRLDAERQTLLRDGEPVALAPKAFQLLLTLVRHGTETVSKDELMKSVWPDTFVEETNLTRNIFALRKVLGESEQNRYIVTVQGRGYRFSEDVRLLPETELNIVAASHSTVRVSVSEINPWTRALIVLAVLLSVAAAALWFLMRRGAMLSSKDTVLLADFVNSTGDPVFDGTLRQGMAVQLEQSPFLSLVPEQRIRRALSLMGQSPEARVAGETTQQVCERTGAVAVIEGSIAMLGSQYVLGLRTKNCQTGGVLDEQQEQAPRKEDVLKALSAMASRFRARVGESLASVERYSTPLAEATTPSIEALKAYSAGLQIHAGHGASAALPFLQRATEIDPQFAMAHAWLGRLYADLDQSGLAAARLARAWQLRERVSDRERFLIEVNYELLARGNMEAAQQTAEAWARAYPREVSPHLALAGLVNKSAGRYESALLEAQKSIKLDPDFWVGYYSLGVLNTYLGRWNEAEAALRAAAARGLDADEFIMLAYDMDFLKGDSSGMEREAIRARARPGGENWMSAREAFVAAWSGRLRDARSISHRAVFQAQQAGQPERASLWAAGAAVREGLFGNNAAAAEWATSALQLSQTREVLYGGALALAIAGETAQAEVLAGEMEKTFPEDSSVRFSYLPVIRALLALNQSDPQRAVELLQVAAPHELGIPLSAVSGLFGALYPIYVRGQAWLAAKKPAEAVIEFSKILEHRAIVVSDPIGALSHLQLGRAYALMGDTAKARSAYQAFLISWKEADPDIPVLKRAQSEYANLP